jgi:hypothetical protein
VKALRILVRVLPALVACLLLSAQPAGRNAPVQGEAFIASRDRDSRPAVDIVTRKQRHAGSLEEYFAIDDDADQFVPSQPQLAVVIRQSTRLVARPEPPNCYRDARPTHRPCAAPATGPPHA